MGCCGVAIKGHHARDSVHVVKTSSSKSIHAFGRRNLTLIFKRDFNRCVRDSIHIMSQGTTKSDVDGYVHNVSEINTAKSGNRYFDFTIQDNENER